MGGPEFGDSSTQRKKYAREVSQGKITHYINHTYEAPPPTPFESMFFTSQEAARVLHPHNDAIVVSAPVANNLVRRILLDNGSSTDIIFRSALDRMKLSGMRPTPISTPLFGFSGERVMTEGTIDLPVTFGTPGGLEVTRIVSFLVVDQPSAYNIIVGRPTLNRLKAITSTYHLMMKFPTEKGIAIMLGDQSMARMCYIQGVDGKGKEKMVSAIL